MWMGKMSDDSTEGSVFRSGNGANRRTVVPLSPNVEFLLDDLLGAVREGSQGVTAKVSTLRFLDKVKFWAEQH